MSGYIVVNKMGFWVGLTGYAIALLLGTVLVVTRIRRTRKHNTDKGATERERLFQRAVEEAGHAIYITDRDGRIEYVNPAFTRITGYSIDEVRGETSRILRSGLMADSYYERLWSTILAGKTWHEDIINRAKRGELYYASQTVAAIPDSRGRPVKFVAIQTDITERRRTEQQLASREYQYRLLAENATDMISRHAPDGRYLYVSPAARSLLGYEPDALIGHSAYELFNPEDLPEIQDSYTSVLDGDRSSVVTYRILHKDGHWVWVETTSRAIRNAESGAIEEIISITRDVGERIAIRRRLEDAILDADRANRTKTEFLANMSHEIKTPLNAILGYSELLCRTITDHDLLSYAELIQNAGTNLLKLLNNVLDMSKIDAGKMSVNPVPSGIRAIAEDVVSMFRLRAAEKDVKLSLEVSDDLPYRVMLDDTRFRQILVNIVGNATKFTDAGTINVRLIVERLDDATVDVVAEIEDSGIGIAKDRLSAIFEPFEQGDPAVTQVRGGTGLGLAITRRLADLLGGQLEVTSTHGRGSCFRVILPALPIVQDADAEIEQHVDPQRVHVLPANTDGRAPWAESSVALLRAELGPETVDSWRRLFRVKMMDDLAEMARVVGESALLLGFPEVVRTAEQLRDAANRFDASTIDTLAPLMERYLYGDAGADGRDN